MRKRPKQLLALTFSFASVLLLGVACKPTKKDINGFDVKDRLTVDYGEIVVLETLFVTDANGWVLENWSLVTDDEGNYVYTENGRFRATDSDGYTITYVVRDQNDNLFEKTTKIIVKGTAKDQITLDATYEQLVSVGEEIQINPICSDANADFKYSVEKKSDGSVVEVDGNVFTLSQAGAYVVSISETKGRAEYEYMLFAQEPFKEGEVEIFDEAWAERQKYTGSKRRSWDVVSTEECGILDPYGQPANYATFTTNKEYISLYLTMRESKEYYQQLAEQGYKSVSMWIYIDSQKTHQSVADRDPLGGSFYRKDGPTLAPGKWMQYTMNLVDSAAAYNRSFVSCYDYYQNEAFRYLLVDNSWDWNKEGGGDTITFYITDVYATKTQTITPVAEVETQKKVADEIEFASLFTADCELEYSVTYRGEKIGIPTTTYEFMGSGEYKVTAVPKLRNLRGSGSITFTVSDDQTIQAKQLIKERNETTLSVALSELEMQFTETNGVTPQITDYKVYYNGNEIKKTANSFVAEKDGCYTIEAKGEYTVGGKSYVSYKTTTVDVWSSGTKYAFIDSANLLYSSIYADWDADPTGSYKSYTVDERTGTMIRSYSKGQSNSVYGKPFYSKYYYEQMLLVKPNASLVMDMYVKATGGSSEYVRGLFTAYKTSTTVKNNVWNRYAITLQKFIDEYDTVVSTYEKYKAIKNGGGRPSQSSNGTGALMLLFGDSSYAREVYMEIAVSENVDNATVSLQDGAEFTLEGENKLSEILDVKLNGMDANILSAEVKFNGSWKRILNDCFVPVWAGAYEFKINARNEEEGLYSVFETVLEIGESDFTYVKDEEVYTLIGTDNFDFATLTDKDYLFEFEIYTNGGYKKSVGNAEIDGTLIKGSSLENGSYLVNVYAVKGEGDFSRILYYTFTLNYFETEDTLVWTHELTQDNYKTILQRYHYADANSSLSSAITLTDTIPEGGVEGTYVKYKQNTKSEDIILAIKPVYEQAYYESLYNDLTKVYHLVFDVYVENQDPAWTKTTIEKKVWNGDKSFSSSGSVKIGTWQTIRVDLQYYLKSWGDFRTFGLNFMSSSYYDKNQRVNFYLGNIRIEETEKEMVWAYTNDTSAVKLYSYSTEKKSSRISITSDIPEGGVAGEYILVTQGDGVEEYRIRVKPAYEKAYYETLLKDTTKKYKVYFDIYLKRSSGTQYLDEWKSATSFGRINTSVSRNTWLTRSCDLSTLVNNWSANGVLLVGWTTATSQSPKTYAYIGNVRLVEETA